MTRKYQDGDPGFSLMRPGDFLPSEHGPATGGDFSWVKGTWFERMRGRSIARSIAELKDGLELSTEYQQAAKAYDESRAGETAPPGPTAWHTRRARSDCISPPASASRSWNRYAGEGRAAPGGQ